MRAVLDTNVLVSAFLTQGGTCDQVLRRMAHGDFAICVDARILGEYERVLRRDRFAIRPGRVAALLEHLALVALHAPEQPLRVTLPHEGDRAFLEVAAAAGAVLVTGNARHFPKRVRKSVRVATPAEFLDLLRRPL